ncbi:MAG: PAS domain S-box protein [Microscillaceae bacterium]|nr:PAS domain S-box protein [Microscillaceae bacterium]
MPIFTKKYYLIFFLVCLGVWQIGWAQKKTIPIAQKGEMDLHNWNFGQSSIALNGEWEFYWRQFLNARDYLADNPSQTRHFARVPAPWNGKIINTKTIGADGYATYRLKVRLPNNQEKLALRLPTISTAFKLMVDGQILLEVGQVGKDKKTSLPDFYPQIVEFTPRQNQTEIIIQVSNFHYRKGGLWESMELGLAKKMIPTYNLMLAMQFFLLGSILIMALYHLGLYGIRRSDRAPLYFSLVCFLVAMRMLFSDNYLIHSFLQVDWFWLVRWEFVSFYPSIAMIIVFVNSVFRQERLRWVNEFCFISAGLYSGVVLFTGPKIFTYLAPPFQLVSLSLAAYMFYVICLALIRSRQGSIAFAIGFGVLLTGYITDLLFVNNIITVRYVSVGFGLFAFIFSQAFLLSVRFSKAFIEKENLAEALNYTNQNLEKLVEQKTQSLQETNQELVKKQETLKAAEQKLLRNAIDLLDVNTELTTAKLELEKLSFFQKSILNSAELSIISTDLSGVITSFNPTSERWLGYQAPELIGKSSVDIFLAKKELMDLEVVDNEPLIKTKLSFEVILKNYKTRPDEAIEWVYRRADGSKMLVLLRVSEIKDEFQEVIGYLGVANDITESKKAEEKVRRQQELLREMERFAKIGAWEYNLQTDEFMGSDELNNIIGLPSDFQLISNNSAQYNTEHDELVYDKIMHTAETGATQEFEIKFSNGKWVNYFITKIEDDLGNPKLEAVVQDITPRKEAEEKMQTIASRLTTLIESMQAGVLLETEHRTIVLVNQVFCELFEIPVDKSLLIGADCSQSAEQSKHLFKYSEAFVQRVDKILLEKKPVVDEVLELKDGRFLERDYVPIVLNGQYLGHLWLYEDITERKIQEKTLILMNAEAIQNNQRLEEQGQRIRYQFKQIKDSINYASRMQKAVLPTDAQASRLLKNYFVMYKPKDVVSGDFYWMEQVGDKIVLAVVDCTGHGVPGAFMSMLGNSFLDSIVIQNQVLQADNILYELNRHVNTILKQEVSDINDGMDVGICVIDQQNQTLEFAGAQSNLVYVQNQEIFNIRGGRFSVGGGKIDEPFLNHTIDYSSPTTFYLFSDGYHDQLGGEKGKKFLSTRFREMLFAGHNLPMKTQKQILESRFKEWKGKYEQTDDVLVLGFKLS